MAQINHTEADRLREELTEFLYIISHDFNAPIRHVNGFATLLKDRNAGKFDDKSLAFIDQILQANERMSGMLEGILSLSRINTRQTDFKTIGLGAIIGDILHEKATLDAEFSSAKVHMNDLPSLSCDEPQVIVAMRALIDNAFLYRKPNGDYHIKIEPVATDNEVGLSVSDIGIGIEQRHFEQIFKPLRRAVSPTDYPGYGIGLSLVAKIMERHGGRVSVSSKLGEGSTFSLFFPKELQVKGAELS